MFNNRVRRICLSSALSGFVLFAPVAAQELEAPATSDNPSVASFESDLVDQGNVGAKELAAASGVSVGEATRSLRLMRQAGNAAHRRAKNGGDSLLRPIIRDGGVVFPRDSSSTSSADREVRDQFDALRLQ